MAETIRSASSLPYHEPDIVTILVHTSLLLLLNLINAALDSVVYCGLLGQVLIGIAWGTPGAKWLSAHAEDTIVQLGYLGLILLVYEGALPLSLRMECRGLLCVSKRQAMTSHLFTRQEPPIETLSYSHRTGGLHTSFQSLRANLLLSCGVALTGITVPIALSYTLQGLLNATPVQAFAAGAALCSTSLGTTFTVLNSSGLAASRLGVVLTSAAMMDDVVGLVMVQVISNLGGDNFRWVTVVRPVLVSVAFAVTAPVVCLFVVRPATLYLNRHREAHPRATINKVLCSTNTAFMVYTLVLIALVTGATYAGTSNLFAAYIAGASVSWWDSEVPHVDTRASKPQKAGEKDDVATASAPTTSVIEGPRPAAPVNLTRGSAIYEHYYHAAVSKILQPLFFASIGFSIPITKMFKGSIVWRGMVYTVLMAIGKLVCGLWLVRFSGGFALHKGTAGRLLSKVRLPSHIWGKSERPARTPQAGANTTQATATRRTPMRVDSRSSPHPPKPFSLHPPLMLALAMCARGEIGFLISGVAESNGVFSGTGEASSEPSDIFLVVTWAIVLCTIVGPLGVGLLVRRVKKLQEERKNRQQEGAGRDVLGVWGVG
jgi:Kef-type K+ transport system membrane component KefB